MLKIAQSAINDNNKDAVVNGTRMAQSGPPYSSANEVYYYGDHPRHALQRKNGHPFCEAISSTTH